MSIEITLHGKCRGCPFLKIEQSSLYALDIPIMTTVSCKNQQLCDHLEKHLQTRGDPDAIGEVTGR